MDVIWDLWMIMVIVPGFGSVIMLTKASQSAFFCFGGGRIN